MDGVVIILIAVLLLALHYPSSTDVGLDDTGMPIEQIQVNPRLNPSMTHDEHAFMKIANELGFH